MKFVCTLFSFLFSLVCLAQNRLAGYIHDEVTGKPLSGTRVTLSVLDSVKFYPQRLDSLTLQVYNIDTRYDTVYKRLKSSFTDSNGYYFFDSLETNFYELIAFHRTKEIRPGTWEGEFFKKVGLHLDGSCGMEKSFQLHVTCEYDSTKNLSHCPICKKKDKLLLIKYGMPAYPFKPEPGYYYNGYCEVDRCHPTKRCMRCKHEF